MGSLDSSPTQRMELWNPSKAKPFPLVSEPHPPLELGAATTLPSAFSPRLALGTLGSAALEFLHQPPSVAPLPLSQAPRRWLQIPPQAPSGTSSSAPTHHPHHMSTSPPGLLSGNGSTQRPELGPRPILCSRWCLCSRLLSFSHPYCLCPGPDHCPAPPRGSLWWNPWAPTLPAPS